MRRRISTKKLFFLCFLILLCGSFSGCKKEVGRIQTIIAPENEKIVIGGTWVIEKLGSERIEKENLPDELKALGGKDIQFADHYVQVGDYLLKNPRYKTKTVDGQKYTLYGQKKIDKDYQIKPGNIQVVTVYDKDRSFCEVVTVDNNRAILFVENLEIYLRKTSDKTEGIKKGAVGINDGNNGLFFGSRQDGTGKTGVLLGLRGVVTNAQGEKDYEYRTLWISSVDKAVGKVKEKKDLFYPRRNGFWKLWVQSNEIYTKAVNGEAPIKLLRGFQTDESSKKWVDFLCNDYISIQIKDKGMDSLARKRIIPIEELPSTFGISASELLGNQGIEAIHEGLAKAMLQHGVVNGTVVGDEENLWNFGVTRKMGHWFLEGRFYYEAGSGNFSADYAINLIPPGSLIFYDEAKVAWTDIKDNVPEAVDAFTSPNGDIAMIFTKKSLLVYGITKGKLDLMPLKKIPLKEGEQPVMSEWATGRYINFWEDAFDKESLPR